MAARSTFIFEEDRRGTDFLLYFLVKKGLLLVEKLLFLFDARKTSFITTLFYALL